MSYSLTYSQIKLVHSILEEIILKSRIKETVNHIQHGTTSVFEHCLSVAYFSLKFSSLFHSKIDEYSIIRGALLHDYFLYDWHDKSTRVNPHGYLHPKVALKNAQEIFDLNHIETDIIKHHMFPLTICPPHTKEGIFVSLADKYCSIYETLKINEWFDGKFSRKKWEI